jgi:hypothetical protein
MQHKQPRQDQRDQDRIVNTVLLSKTELQWLLGEVKVSKFFEYQIRSRIKKKVQTLIDLELPLLIQAHFINFENNTGLGRDLEPVITPSGLVKSIKALVRQMSLSIYGP